MSDSEKYSTRPKVRFSKSAGSPEQLHVERAFGKPKIRSVTDFGPRVKILKRPCANEDFERSSSPEEIISRYSAGDAPNNPCFCPLKSTSVSTPCLTAIDPIPEKRNSNFHTTRESAARSDNPPNTSRKILNDKRAQNDRHELLRTLKKQSAQVDQVSKTVVKDQRSSAKWKSSSSGKENIPVTESRQSQFNVPENTPRTKSETGTKSTVSQSTKLSETTIQRKPKLDTVQKHPDFRKAVKINQDSGTATKVAEKAMKIRTEARKHSTVKPIIGLMPCMKTAKSRDKIIPTKKTIHRDALASSSKVYVGPGLPRSKTPEPENSKREKIHRSHSEIHSGDKLRRPEYNSIICTIKKLRDAREENIVGDLEHLPSIYKRLVKGKVSSALDFGANEAIYRDLVDLSIDEKQLPSRVMRSKDPEPRKRDLVPQLSDFFIPSNDEEFRKAVYVRPPSPRVLDTWNPYTISDRIFSWKNQLDQ